MRFVSGTTANEKKLVLAVQAAVGAVQDNSIGQQTLVDIACKLNADCFPLSISIFHQEVIVARDITPLEAREGLVYHPNAISGSFSYNQKPCSILVKNGEVVCNTSCHYWINGTPEAVLYRLKNGAFGIKRCRTTQDLPNNVAWAIGGVGMLDLYDPAKEGFSGKYADVLRRTNHTFVGTKNGYVFMGYCSNMTGAQVNVYLKKLGLDRAIMLDGGHVAAINCAEASVNTAQKQYYVVRAVR